MKKFIINIVVLIIVGLVCASMIDFVISKKIREKDDRNIEDYCYHETKYDVLINGASRARQQYDPFIIDSVLGTTTFNLGADGYMIDQQIVRYKVCCERNKIVPKLLIQNIDFKTIEESTFFEKEEEYSYFFYDRELTNTYRQYRDNSVLDYYIPLFRFRGHYGTFMTLLTESLHNNTVSSGGGSINRNGFLGINDVPFNGDELERIDSVQFVCNPAMMQQFEKFIQATQKQGTKIVFVYAPIYKGVNDRMGRNEIDKMYATYKQIADKYDIHVLNYNEHEMCGDTQYFVNGTHTNLKGAQLFTRMLAADLDSMGVLR